MLGFMLEKRQKIARIISLYVLPIGVLSFFLGVFFLSGRNSFKTVFYLAVLAPTLITLLLEWRLFLAVKLSPILQAALIFLLFASISIFWSDSDRSFLHYLKRELYIFSFIMAFVCIYTYSPKRFMQVLAAGCIGASAFAGYFLIDHYVIKGAGSHSRVTGAGVLYNPLLSAHVFGFYMALLLGLLLQMNWDWKKNTAVIGLLLPVTMFVLMTHSRTPLLGLMAIMLVYLLINRNKKSAIIFCGFLAIGALIYYCYPAQFSSRGLSYRPWIWRYTLGVISEQPIWGTGVNNTFAVPYPQDVNQGKGAWADPHNIHLSVILRVGLMGFSLWLLMYWNSFRGMVLETQSKYNKAFFLVLVFGAACALTEGGAFFSRPKEHWFIIWLPIALCVAAQVSGEIRKRL